MARYIEIGLDEFVVPEYVLGADTAEKRDNMDQFLDEVAIQLQGHKAPEQRTLHKWVISSQHLRIQRDRRSLTGRRRGRPWSAPNGLDGS